MTVTPAFAERVSTDDLANRDRAEDFISDAIERHLEPEPSPVRSRFDRDRRLEGRFGHARHQDRAPGAASPIPSSMAKANRALADHAAWRD
ncbi:hypothetical protein [Paracoccus aminovorans]|uniref:hypothetical protein n=1 Tax=Paracoccus aminovorans TaxID=34004 RepID=UPI0018D52F98|nr:hypothetical protein [Paracoccus aminovorans]